MDIEWTPVEGASSYEVTYNNLETEHVKTLTGIIDTKATLMDLEPASRYQIYVVSVQEKVDFSGESEVFPSYTGEPIHGITQIDAPSMVCSLPFFIKLIAIKGSSHQIRHQKRNSQCHVGACRKGK